jgi:uncharacterized protein
MALEFRKSGNEFLVNTQTASNQFEPTITGLTNGGFVGSGQDGALSRLREWYTADLRPGQTTPLSLLMIQGTRFCNIDCKYCYLPLRSSKGTFDLDLIDPLFRKLDHAGLIGEELTVLWHAGEPLVLPVAYYRDAFARVAARAPAHTRIHHHFQTNATLVTNEYCALFKDFDVQIGVSIDGPADLHDANRVTRAGKGTHAATMAGVQKLRDHGIRYSAICVAGRAMLDRPDDVYEFFRDLGAEQVGFNIEELEGVHATTSLATRDAKQSYKTFLRRILQRNQQDENPFACREAKLVAGVPTANGGDGGRPQEAMDFGIISVDLEGNLFTYSPELLDIRSDAGGDYAIGSIEGLDFPAIARSAKFQAVKTQIDAGIDICRATCQHFGLCGGGVPVNKLSENGTFASGETIHCQLTRQAVIELGHELAPPKRPQQALGAIAPSPDNRIAKKSIMPASTNSHSGVLRMSKPSFGASVSEAMAPGIRLSPELLTSGRVSLSAGTVAATSLHQTVEHSDVPFDARAIVPRGPWMRPAPEQVATLGVQRAADDPYGFVSLVSIPSHIMTPLRAVAAALVDNRPAEVQDRTQPIADALLSHFGYAAADRKVPGALAQPSRTIGATIDRSVGRRIGLHLDSWFNVAVMDRKASPNRICVNIGSKPRALLFINLPAAAIRARVATAGHDASPTDMGRAFMRRFPNYPVIRLEVRPGEAYIAPTENIIHDGCALDDMGEDLTFTVIGSFPEPGDSAVGSRQSVRRAQAGDLDRAVELVVEQHPQSAYASVQIEPRVARQFFEQALSDPQQVMLVYQGPGRDQIEGFIIGRVGTYFASSELAGYQTVFLVDPRRRGGLAAHRLWREFCSWAKASGARTVWPGVSSGVSPERTSRFYQGMGMTPVGTVFTSDIDNAIAGAGRRANSRKK